MFSIYVGKRSFQKYDHIWEEIYFFFLRYYQNFYFHFSHLKGLNYSFSMTFISRNIPAFRNWPPTEFSMAFPTAVYLELI